MLRAKPVAMLLVLLSLIGVLTAWGGNFTTGCQAARKHGVHEVALSGDGKGENPFDAVCTVRFTPPSGQKDARLVRAFYDGGNVWRARVYVSEAGRWNWRSQSPTNPELSDKGGSFMAEDSGLPGMLRPHAKNPAQWMADDGRWFLNLNDTAYFLFNRTMTKWQKFVEEDWRLGVTSLRVGGLGGLDWDRVTNFTFSNYPWDGDDKTRYDLEKFQTTDLRLQWMLDHYPGMYMQLILFGLKEWAKDNTGQEWTALPASVRTNTMDYMMARWAAFPQLSWLIVNDMHCDESFPNNQRFAREAGKHIAAHDPWRHPLSTGPKRSMPFPFTGPDDAWVSYVHLEDAFEVGADLIDKYRSLKVPIFLGEDRYEQDRPTRDVLHPRYYYRWLIWSWLLSGGSVSYGGRFGEIIPYSETGAVPYDSGHSGEDKHTYHAALQGLDSLRFIKAYLQEREIELWPFEPDDALAADLDGAVGRRRPKLMRRGQEEFIVYHPNALAEGRGAALDSDSTPRFKLNLGLAQGGFAAEWFNPQDGRSMKAGLIRGGGWVEFVSPWRGSDVVLRLLSERAEF